MCLLLHQTEGDLHIRRSLGVAAPLFVILILPELWKNRGNDAMEVEGTTFYTIRQVYAARLTLFAGVDLLLLTAFFCGATYFARITLWDLMIQFLLPFNVACCICFRCLYGGRNQSEALCVLLCSVWCGLWVLVISSEPLYNAISVPVWATMLVLSFAYLVYTLCRGQQTIYKTWEAKYKSDDYKQNDIAFHWRMGIDPVRDMLYRTFSPGLQNFNYYLAETLSPSVAGEFYSRRVELLRSYLYEEDNNEAELLSDREKEYLISQYEKLEGPIYYDYHRGWYQVLSNLAFIMLLGTLVLGYLVSGIFSNEFKWKSDAVFFTTYHGRSNTSLNKFLAKLV